MRPSRLLDADGEHRLEGGEPVEEGDALCVMTSGSTADPKAASADRRGRGRVGPRLERCARGGSRAAPMALLPALCSHRRALGDHPLAPDRDPGPGHRPTGACRSARGSAARGATHVSLVATASETLRPERLRADLARRGCTARRASRQRRDDLWHDGDRLGRRLRRLPLAGVELAIEPADDTGLGEILLKGPMLLRSYRDRPARSLAAPTAAEAGCGRGDLGRLSPAGLLEVRGRRIGGHRRPAPRRSSPHDVERVLAEVAGVAEVAVWKRPDPEWGERVVAFVVPAGEPPSLDELRARGQRSASRPMPRPRSWSSSASLPRTDSGKLRRGAL